MIIKTKGLVPMNFKQKDIRECKLDVQKGIKMTPVKKCLAVFAASSILLVSCFINFCFSEDAEKIFDLSSEVYSYEYTIPDDKSVNLDFSVIPAKDNQGNAVIYVKYAAVSDEHNITLEVIDSSSGAVVSSHDIHAESTPGFLRIQYGWVAESEDSAIYKNILNADSSYKFRISTNAGGPVNGILTFCNVLNVIKLTVDSDKIIINDNVSTIDVPAQIINNRTMVPLRAIFEALGASVEWDDSTKTVNAEKDGIKISLEIGKREIVVDGVSKTIDAYAKIVDSRTLVPVRAIAEAFECDVEWDDTSKTVTITEI